MYNLFKNKSKNLMVHFQLAWSRLRKTKTRLITRLSS